MAHKSVLRASPFWKTMLDSRFKEGLTKGPVTVKLGDAGATEVRIVKKYLYTGYLPLGTYLYRGFQPSEKQRKMMEEGDKTMSFQSLFGVFQISLTWQLESLTQILVQRMSRYMKEPKFIHVYTGMCNILEDNPYRKKFRDEFWHKLKMGSRVPSSWHASLPALSLLTNEREFLHAVNVIRWRMKPTDVNVVNKALVDAVLGFYGYEGRLAEYVERKLFVATKQKSTEKSLTLPRKMTWEDVPDYCFYESGGLKYESGYRRLCRNREQAADEDDWEEEDYDYVKLEHGVEFNVGGRRLR
uniref:BTB domain-containing protein n=1 Tax=Lotharella oceanica TaxID=641309 RepID=A0A7S2XAX2_9EUKA